MKETSEDNINSDKKKPAIWSKEEDDILIEKSKEYGYKNWALVAAFIPGRTAIQCSARYKRIQPGLVKGAWTPEEDKELLRLFKYYGKNWSNISKSMPQRTGKQIRDRFLNALDENLKKDKFSIEEDKKVIKWYKVYGNAWCKIAKKIKGRTGDMVKNRFYSSLKNHIDDYDDLFDDNEKDTTKKRKYRKKKKKNELLGKKTKRKYTKRKKTDTTNKTKSKEEEKEKEQQQEEKKLEKTEKFPIINNSVNINISPPIPTQINIDTPKIININPLIQTDPILTTPKTQNEDKSPNNTKSFASLTNSLTANNIKVPNNVPMVMPKQKMPTQNKTIPLLRRNSSAIIRMQSSIDTTNINNGFDDFDSSFVISDRKVDKTISLLKYRNDSYSDESKIEDSLMVNFQSKVDLLKTLINSQNINGVKKDNWSTQLSILQELKNLTKEKINSLTQSK